MPVRIFQLRGVPEDEADEVRKLLEANAIHFYETPPGNWGISSPALWLQDDTEAERARRLIGDYQVQRERSERQRFDQMRALGQHPTVWQSLRREPFKVIGLTLFAVLILYFSIVPFIELG